MKWGLGFAGLITLFVLNLCVAAAAESHRATRLGNPATRFAPPVSSVDELRSRFADPKLRLDIASVLKQWGWSGNVSDLLTAAGSVPMVETNIAVGQVMPFMSSRESGRAVCLRNVTWAGQDPEPAYAFTFSSKGKRYRCITPKACSNFFLEELGPEPRHGLVVDCAVTNRALVGQRIVACITVHNTGNVPLSQAFMVLPLPAEATLLEMTVGGQLTREAVSWPVANLPAGVAQQFCAIFKSKAPGAMTFQPSVTAPQVPVVQSSCQTTVVGVSALLLEKADDPDPVPVGGMTTYTVKVTNQGSADDTDIKIVVTFPEHLDPVQASNSGEVSGKVVKFPAFERLPPKQAFEYSITARGVKAGDSRVTFVRTSDQIPAPTMAEESTRVY